VKRRASLLLLLAVLLLALPGSAWAQNYSFQMTRQTVDLFMNADGTVDIDFEFEFANNQGGAPIDFVDVGFPNDSYSLSNVSAEVNGQRVATLETSPYVDSGVAVGLGPNAIPPGQTGRVRVFVSGVEDMFFTDNSDDTYASLQVSPTWFDSKFVTGSTDLRVTLHMPPGVGPEDPRWQPAPSGFPEEPETGIDDQGRVVYSWRNPSARGDRQYLFGASVPKSALPASAISTQTELPSPGASSSFDPEALIGFLFCGGIFAFILFVGWIGVTSQSRRKLKYLPPKISIGGHGVKRGLTAVEAAILLETPMDKVLTMILFAVIKKEAASVVSRDPLELDIADPLPQGLRTYEQDFLVAFGEKDKRNRRKALQDVMVKLIKAVAKKMKGFSKRETVNYYRDITQRAWSQVEAADTPEVKSKAFDEVMEWTMLDREFEDRTQDVFRTGPVFVPVWWGRYDPGFGGGAARPATVPTSAPAAPGGRGGVSLPTLPGSAFAANMVNGIQNFSSNVVGNLTSFTGNVTKVTNPPPPPSKSGGGWSGGGSSCACACAGCACACACAGGGR
jgi:hypothetical protein